MSYRFSSDHLRQAREAKGWSRARLARAVLTGEGQIRRWESGSNEPRVGMVAALALVLGQSIEFFLVETDEDPEDEVAA